MALEMHVGVLAAAFAPCLGCELPRYILLQIGGLRPAHENAAAAFAPQHDYENEVRYETFA